MSLMQIKDYICVIYNFVNFWILTRIDPDMLEVGNGGMSLEEYRSHFSIWALMKVRSFSCIQLLQLVSTL